jgi:hypothetical protein
MLHPLPLHGCSQHGFILTRILRDLFVNARRISAIAEIVV